MKRYCLHLVAKGKTAKEINNKRLALLMMLPCFGAIICAVTFGICTFITVEVSEWMKWIRIVGLGYLVLFVLQIAASFVLPPVINADATKNDGDNCPNKSEDFEKPR